MLLLTVLLLSPLAAQATPQIENAPQPVRFNRDVRPLLSDRCFHCHGPDAGRRKAGLRLDRATGDDGAYRVRKGVAAIKPGSLEESALWYRLTTTDADDAMPPADSHKQRLSAAQVDVIRRWILQGAEYEDHWAFVAPVAPAVPAGDDADWCKDPIDRFVLRRLRTAGLQPSPRADRRTLIRRVTFDLTGLPPTRDEIAAFLADDAADAYERLVDRLLASPHHGEHLARYWLDLVRFADTNGIHHDHYREMSLYRDWVIRSFADNLPFDRFVVDQVAGDLHAEPTADQQIASGFNRLHLIIDVGTALPEESEARNVTDRVTAVGTAFLGLTVQCAVCHDHKYDPIRQRDFYQLYAFFNNLDGDPETGGRGTIDFRRGLQPPYIEFPSAEQAAQLAAVNARLQVADEVIALLKSNKDATTEEARQRALADELADVEKRRRQRIAERDQILLAVPAAMVMKERADPRPAHILIRGAYDRPGEEVQPDTPAFLPPLQRRIDGNGDARPTRMDLAQWLVSRANPLTARVAVNRFWQQCFGVGLVETSEDFGAQGSPPTDPDLLDHLAVSFVASGWDVRALLRRIVTSETYRQTAVAPTAAFTRDPKNLWLARGSRFCMDAEMIRDQILATSGLLNPTLYGKSVKPPQPPGIWEPVTLPDSFPRTYVADTGDAIYRRSLYTFWKRALPPPQMTLFNAPSRESCIARRERTNTPLQALLLWNEREYLKAARHLAHETLRAAADRPPAASVAVIYETITSQLPDAAETADLLASLADLRAAYAADPALAAKLCEGVELAPGVSAPDLAAWTMLTSAIYNLDITKTRQ